MRNTIPSGHRPNPEQVLLSKKWCCKCFRMIFLQFFDLLSPSRVGTLDLRSSTEELDFQDAQSKTKCRTRPQSPSYQDDSVLGHNRKDSQSSDIVLLSISGRTSRLSSIGSQGSAQSRISNASHLSVMSGQSGTSRSPSPHKMLLETSFCGTKPPKVKAASADESGTKNEPEDLEKVLLSRKHDPTEAIFAEGICFCFSKFRCSCFI